MITPVTPRIALRRDRAAPAGRSDLTSQHREEHAR
ncbi:hypothetical protein BH24ACT8_BH24ACT8_09740 [soil metagenome]